MSKKVDLTYRCGRRIKNETAWKLSIVIPAVRALNLGITPEELWDFLHPTSLRKFHDEQKH